MSYFGSGYLPWKGTTKDEDIDEEIEYNMVKIKQKIRKEQLFMSWPPSMEALLEYLNAVKFKEKIDFNVMKLTLDLTIKNCKYKDM